MMDIVLYKSTENAAANAFAAFLDTSLADESVAHCKNITHRLMQLTLQSWH